MVQNFVTPSIIAKNALAHLENQLVMASSIASDHSDEFVAVDDTIDVRRPVRFLGQSNNLDITGVREDIKEGKVPLKLDQTETIPFEIAPLDMTLRVEDDKFQERYIQPAVTRLKDRIESAVGAEYSKIWNFTGTPGTLPATFKSLGAGGAIMTNAAVPMGDRKAFHNPDTALELADGLKGVFVQGKAKTALEEVAMGRYAGFNNFESVHVPTHTPGVGTGTPLVNGAAQNVTYEESKDTNSQPLITDGWDNSITGIVRKGDVFNIANVFAVNPISKQSTGRLQDFVVNADQDSGATTGPATLNISPAIITTGAYQTVTAAPADNAGITLKTGATGPFPQSILMHKNAMTLVTRPLAIPADGRGLRTKTISGNRVSIAVTEWGDGNTLTHNFRLDILFKVHAIYPDLAVRLTG